MLQIEKASDYGNKPSAAILEDESTYDLKAVNRLQPAEK